jgi:hypothetical protein
MLSNPSSTSRSTASAVKVSPERRFAGTVERDDAGETVLGDRCGQGGFIDAHDPILEWPADARWTLADLARRLLC